MDVAPGSETQTVRAVIFRDQGVGMDEAQLHGFAIAAHHVGYEGSARDGSESEELDRGLRVRRPEQTSHQRRPDGTINRYTNFDLGRYGVGAKRCAFYMGNVLHAFTRKSGGDMWMLTMHYREMLALFKKGEANKDKDAGKKQKDEAWSLNGNFNKFGRLENVATARKQLAQLGVEEETIDNFLALDHGTVIVIDELNESFVTGFADIKATEDVITELINAYGPTYIQEEKIRFIVDGESIPTDFDMSAVPLAMKEAFKASHYGCLPEKCRGEDVMHFTIRHAHDKTKADVNVAAFYYPRVWNPSVDQLVSTATWQWKEGPQFFTYFNGRIVNDAKLCSSATAPLLPGLENKKTRKETQTQYLAQIAFFVFLTGVEIAMDKNDVMTDMNWLFEEENAIFDSLTPLPLASKFWKWAERCHETYDSDIDVSADGMECRMNGRSMRAGDVVVVVAKGKEPAKAVTVACFKKEDNFWQLYFAPYFHAKSDYEKDLTAELQMRIRESGGTGGPGAGIGTGSSTRNRAYKTIVYNIDTGIIGDELTPYEDDADAKSREMWPQSWKWDLVGWEQFLTQQKKDLSRFPGYDVPPNSGREIEAVAADLITLPYIAVANGSDKTINAEGGTTPVFGTLAVRVRMRMLNSDGDVEKELKVLKERSMQKNWAYIEQYAVKKAGQYTIEASVESTHGLPIELDPLIWTLKVHPADPKKLVAKSKNPHGLKLQIGQPIPFDQLNLHWIDTSGNVTSLDHDACEFEIQPLEKGVKYAADGVLSGQIDIKENYSIAVRWPPHNLLSDPVPASIAAGDAVITVDTDLARMRIRHGTAFTVHGNVHDSYGNAIRPDKGSLKLEAVSSGYRLKVAKARMVTRMETTIDDTEFDLEIVPWQEDGARNVELKLTLPGHPECEDMVCKHSIVAMPKLRFGPGPQISEPDGLVHLGGTGERKEEPMVLGGSPGNYKLDLEVDCDPEDVEVWRIVLKDLSVKVGKDEKAHQVTAEMVGCDAAAAPTLYLLLKPVGGEPERLKLKAPKDFRVAAGSVVKVVTEGPSSQASGAGTGTGTGGALVVTAVDGNGLTTKAVPVTIYRWQYESGPISEDMTSCRAPEKKGTYALLVLGEKDIPDSLEREIAPNKVKVKVVAGPPRHLEVKVGDALQRTTSTRSDDIPPRHLPPDVDVVMRKRGDDTVEIDVTPEETLSFHFYLVDMFGNPCPPPRMSRSGAGAKSKDTDADNMLKRVQLVKRNGLSGWLGYAILDKRVEKKLSFRDEETVWGEFKSSITGIKPLKIVFNVQRKGFVRFVIDRSRIKTEYNVVAGEGNLPPDLSLQALTESAKIRLEDAKSDADAIYAPSGTLNFILWWPPQSRAGTETRTLKNANLAAASVPNLEASGRYNLKVVYSEERPKQPRMKKEENVCAILVEPDKVEKLWIDAVRITDAQNCGTLEARTVVHKDTNMALHDRFNNVVYNTTGVREITITMTAVTRSGTGAGAEVVLETVSSGRVMALAPLLLNRGHLTLQAPIFVPEFTASGDYELKFCCGEAPSVVVRVTIADKTEELELAMRKRDEANRLVELRRQREQLRAEMKLCQFNLKSANDALESDMADRVKCVNEIQRIGGTRIDIASPGGVDQYVSIIRSRIKDRNRAPRGGFSLRIPPHLKDDVIRVADVLSVDNADYSNVLATLIGQNFEALLVPNTQISRQVREWYQQQGLSWPTIFINELLTAEPRPIPTPARCLNESGNSVVLGLASQFVECAPDFTKLRHELFGRLVLLSNHLYMEEYGKRDPGRNAVAFSAEDIYTCGRSRVNAPRQRLPVSFGNRESLARLNSRVVWHHSEVTRLEKLIIEGQKTITSYTVQLAELDVALKAIEDELQCGERRDVGEERPRRIQRREK